MDESGMPTLSEVAQTIYWEDGLDIEQELTDGLRRAGFSVSDEKERKRLRNLVITHSRLRRDDCINEQLAEVAHFVPEARRELGEDADIEDVIELAADLKSDFEDDDD